MQAQQTEHVPLVRDFGEIRESPRHIIEALLADPKCLTKVKLFFVDGGVCGHKVMDLKGAVDVLKEHDKQGRLKDLELKDFHLGNALKNALRSRYTLNKRWKIVGENKRLAATGEPPWPK